MANAFGGLAGHELRWLGGEEGKKRRTWTGDGESRRNGGGDICGHGEVGKKETDTRSVPERAAAAWTGAFCCGVRPGARRAVVWAHAILLFAVSLCIYYTLEFDFKILSPITMLM
jgi:hypothetical protein